VFAIILVSVELAFAGPQDTLATPLPGRPVPSMQTPSPWFLRYNHGIPKVRVGLAQVTLGESAAEALKSLGLPQRRRYWVMCDEEHEQRDYSVDAGKGTLAITLTEGLVDEIVLTAHGTATPNLADHFGVRIGAGANQLRWATPKSTYGDYVDYDFGHHLYERYHLHNGRVSAIDLYWDDEP